MELSDLLPQRFSTKRLPWEELRLMPIGDIQFDGLPNSACDIDRLQRHLTWGVRNDVVFFGMGDYTDFASPSNRAHLKSAGLYDTTQRIIEQAADTGLERLKEILEPTRGRWLGLLEGHHFFEFEDGTTTDMQLAKFLGAPFLGTCAMLRLTFGRQAKGKGINCVIWAHHGVGSGVTVAAPLNKLERVAAHFDADIYLMAHHHKAVSAMLDRLYVTSKGKPALIDRTKALVATGSFLRGYMQGSQAGPGRPRGGYVEQRMLMPVALGGPLLTITPRHHEFYEDLDIKVSV